MEDKLCASDIISRLPKGCLCKKAVCFDILDSTNIKAKQLAEQGEEEGLLIVAQEQSAGRGRRGRRWSSEAATGIYMTLLLRPKLLPQNVSGLTLLAALALTDAIREVCGIETQIKWPNDVVIAKKKICGILTEMSSEENVIHYVILGIGINANATAFPKEIEDMATSIYLHTGKRVNRCELIAGVVQRFCEYYERFCKEQDLTSFVEAYNSVLANRDKEVKVYYGMVESAVTEEIDLGVARGIDREGALLIEIDGTIKRIVSGEVSVRGLYGYV